MSIESSKTAAAAAKPKKNISVERKALRSEMNHLYGKIADSFKRRAHNGWVRP